MLQKWGERFAGESASGMPRCRSVVGLEKLIMRDDASRMHIAAQHLLSVESLVLEAGESRGSASLIRDYCNEVVNLLIM